MSKTKPFTKFEIASLLVLLVGHATAAYTSFGYHHPDEYYQIIEWANAFLGWGDPTRLAWEYSAQIRPWLQPLIHAGVMRFFFGLGIYEPFFVSLFLQLTYGGLNILALVSLWKYFKSRYALDPKWFLCISLLWFFPYIHVRTSSENLAGIFLSFSFLAILKYRRFFWGGALFGFAFLARYQIALGLIGVGIVLVIHERKISREHGKLLIGFLTATFFGTLLDRIGYGSWVFTPYRYFAVNLLDGVAATYNPYPWYQYFIWIVQLNPFISLPLFFGCIVFLKKGHPEDRLWIGSFVWSFFVLHCFITNKEYRFLFPILNLIPFMAATAFSSFTPKLSRTSFWMFYGFLNFSAFSISTLHGASVKTMGSLYLAHRHLDPERPVFSSRDYRIQSPYYTFPPHSLTVIQNSDQLAEHLRSSSDAQVLLDGMLDEAMEKSIAILEAHPCKTKESALPAILYHFKNQLPFLKKTPYVAWYDCKK